MMRKIAEVLEGSVKYPIMAKQKSKRRAQQQKGPIDKYMPFAIGAVVIVAAYFLISALSGPSVGYAVEDRGRDHMNPSGIGGCQPNYITRPPTSGCHHPSILNYEIYDSVQPDQNLVHNLEHGAIVISYRPSTIPGEDDFLVDEITDLIQDLQQEDSKYCRLILTPYDRPFSAESVPELAETASQMKIALTAWTKIDMMEEYAEERVKAFIDANINKGPENLNDCR